MPFFTIRIRTQQGQDFNLPFVLKCDIIAQNPQQRQRMHDEKISVTNGGLKVLTLVMAVCIVIFIVCAILGNHVKYGGLVFFLVTLMISLVPLYRFRKFCRQLEADGKFS